MTTVSAWVFVQAVALGYLAFWALLFAWHQGELLLCRLDHHEFAGLRHEALRMAVALSVMWALVSLMAPDLPQEHRLRLSGAASGLWIGCAHAFWLSAQWWRSRTLWKVR